MSRTYKKVPNQPKDYKAYNRPKTPAQEFLEEYEQNNRGETIDLYS